MFHEYQYTSPPVYLCISIPVYLYTSHTKASVYQSTCIPVTQKSSIPVHLYTSHKNTSIPVASIPAAAVTTLPLLMSAPYKSSPLAAVVYESSPLAAVVISTWTTSVPTALVCNSRPQGLYYTALVKIPGLKDYYYTALVKIPGL